MIYYKINIIIFAVSDFSSVVSLQSDDAYQEAGNNTNDLPAQNKVDLPKFSWHYVRCPPENECLNGHHTCSAKSEKCFDLDDGYECMCGDGYRNETYVSPIFTYII